MTYAPRVGDRVRRTYPSGTTVQGEIARVTADVFGDGGLDDPVYLYSPLEPRQTELLHRPKPEPKLGEVWRTEHGTGIVAPFPGAGAGVMRGDLVLVYLTRPGWDALDWVQETGEKVADAPGGI